MWTPIDVNKMCFLFFKILHKSLMGCSQCHWTCTCACGNLTLHTAELLQLSSPTYVHTCICFYKECTKWQKVKWATPVSHILNWGLFFFYQSDYHSMIAITSILKRRIMSEWQGNKTHQSNNQLCNHYTLKDQFHLILSAQTHGLVRPHNDHTYTSMTISFTKHRHIVFPV